MSDPTGVLVAAVLEQVATDLRVAAHAARALMPATRVQVMDQPVYDVDTVLAECTAKVRIVRYCLSAIEVGQIRPNTTWNDDAAGAEVAARVLRLMDRSEGERHCG